MSAESEHLNYDRYLRSLDPTEDEGICEDCGEVTSLGRMTYAGDARVCLICDESRGEDWA